MSSLRSGMWASKSRRLLKISSVQGSSQPSLVDKTLPQYWKEDILQQFGSKPALISRHEDAAGHRGRPTAGHHLMWDFCTFDAHIHALARGLIALGVRKGDRVGVVMGNNSTYAVLQWACASIGAILATINPAYRADQLISTLKLSGVQHLFLCPRIRTSKYVEMLSSALPGLRYAAPGNIQESVLPDLRSLIVVDNNDVHKEGLRRLDVRSLIDCRDVLLWREDTHESIICRELYSSLDKDDVINIQFTSGTTGLPKGVSLSHHNLLNNALSIGKCMQLTEDDIVCNVPPLFHCFGNLAAWVHGSCIVYPSEIFDPHAIVDTVVQEKCTALHGVPTHFLGVLQEVAKRKDEGRTPDMSSLRTGIAAGSSIPIELMRKLITQLHLRDLTIAYGMTETSPVSFQTTSEDPVSKRVETVGKVQPHVKAKIVDPDGNIVPIDTPGELLVSGYLLQKGYWKDELQTEESMQLDSEGTLWMRTGDEGTIDEEGYLKIVGRIKDIIIRGGENLFPVQIENALTEDDRIREAAAVSVPDDKYGEVVGAWIVRTPGTHISRAEVRRSVLTRINPQNGPSWVWFLGEDVPDELPKTASGKIMKHVLRDWSRDLAKREIGRVHG